MLPAPLDDLVPSLFAAGGLARSGAVSRAGAPQAVPDLDGEAGLTGAVAVVARPDPLAILSGQGRDDVDMVVRLPHGDLPHRLLVAAGRESEPADVPGGRCRPTAHPTAAGPRPLARWPGGRQSGLPASPCDPDPRRAAGRSVRTPTCAGPGRRPAGRARWLETVGALPVFGPVPSMRRTLRAWTHAVPSRPPLCQQIQTWP